MATKDKFKKFILDTLNRLKQDHNLGDYELSICEHPDEGGPYSAEIHVDLEYMRCTIHIWPPVREAFEDGDLDTVREDMAHELAHIRVEPLKELTLKPYKTEQDITRENEKLAEFVGRLMYKHTYGKSKQPRGIDKEHVRSTTKRKHGSVRKQSVRPRTRRVTPVANGTA